MRSRPLLILSALAVACSHEAGAAAGAAAAGRPADPLAFLSKDDGKPWPADEHTRTIFAAMAKAMRDATPDASPARTTELGRQLQELRDQLFAGCTMTGPAHDALHGYLGVLLPAVQAMTDADVAAARQARAEVAALLPRFAEYFR